MEIGCVFAAVVVGGLVFVLTSLIFFPDNETNICYWHHSDDTNR